MTDPTGPRVGGEDRSTQEGEAPPSPRRVVGVLADPDRPIEIAEAIADGLLPRLLAAELGDDVVWEVHTCTRPLAAGEEDMSEMLDAAARLRARETWDWAVYITDLPIRSDGRPLLADVCVGRGVATLSLPGLGMLALQRRAAAVVVRLVAALCGAAERTRVERGVLHRHRATRRIEAVTSPIRSTSVGDGDSRERLHTPPVRGRIRLLAGMIHTNHPGRLVLGMSSAFGATVAASAFMVFNSSTWRIATTAGSVRLPLAVVAAALLMTAWIVARHGLWERRRHHEDRELVHLYNLATLATIGQGVLVLIGATFLIDLGAVLFLISPEALTTTLERPPVLSDWFAIAALATVAATLAGAVGIGLQREQDVRNAAYGYRQREHRRGARDEGSQ